MEQTTTDPSLASRCLTCGRPLDGAANPAHLPFCSHRHFTYSIFGEPALRKTQRHEQGQVWPAEASDEIKDELQPYRKAFKARREERRTAPPAYPPGSIFETRSYKLSKWERVYLREFAKKINAMHRETNDNRNRYLGDDEEINIVGFAGEFVFARLFNCFPDLFTLEIRTRKDRGGAVDAYLPNGLRVDVKTSRKPADHRRCGLNIEGNKSEDDVDLYCLMLANDFPTIRYAGFIPSYHAHTNKYATDWGHFVPRSALRTKLPRYVFQH